MKIAWSLYEITWLRLVNEDFRDIDQMLNEALLLFRELDDLEGEVWTLIYLGTYACIQHDYTTAQQRANEVLKRLEDIAFPWAVAGAHYLLGDIALATGSHNEARQQYMAAIKIAHEVQSVMQTIRHLTGLTEWIMYDETADKKTALLLAVYIQCQPASALDTRKRIDRLYRQLEAHFTPEVIAEMEQRTETMTLDDAVVLALQTSAASQTSEQTVT
jgi:tetratricopeptide (TPR) repeat protein